MHFNPRYGMVGLIGSPYMLIAETLGPWIEALSYVLVFLGWWYGTLSLSALGLFLMFSAGLTAVLTLAALAVFDWNYRVLSLGDIFRLSILAAAEYLGYRQVIWVARVMGTFKFFTGDKSWNKLERRGYARAAA